MASPLTAVKFHSTKADGTDNAAGKIYTYAAGTTTPQATYTTAGGGTPNANPVILDGTGRASIYLAPGLAYKFVCQDSAGAAVPDGTVDNWSDTGDTLRADLANTADATKGDFLLAVKRTEAGSLATTQHVVNQTRPLCPKADYGAIGDGTTNDYAALSAWVAGLKTQTSPRVILPDGMYFIGDNTLTLDLPDGATGTFFGTFKSTAVAKSAIVVGRLADNAAFYDLRGLKVYRTTTDTVGTSVGIELLNLIACSVGIQECYFFFRNVKAHGNGRGFSYNNISLGALRDGVKNLVLTSSAGGYCNECNWYGGTFNHNSSYDPLIATVNLEIENVAPRIGNHRFYGPSFEDSAAGTLSTAAIINGDQNVIFWPRLERNVSPTTYLIQFTANSTGCALDGSGFGVNATNIEDLGMTNSWAAYDQTSLKRSTPDTAGKGVIRARSTNTSSARVLLVEDAAGVETATIRGDGRLTLPTLQSFGVAAGVSGYANDAAAAAGGVLVGGFYRNGSVVQIRVV